MENNLQGFIPITGRLVKVTGNDAIVLQSDQIDHNGTVLSEILASNGVNPSPGIHPVYDSINDIISESNKTYILEGNYDLDEDLIIPENCKIIFNNASISGDYNIHFNDTELFGPIDIDVKSVSGKLSNDTIHVKWFGAKADGSNAALKIRQAISVMRNGATLKFEPKEYTFGANTGVEYERYPEGTIITQGSNSIDISGQPITNVADFAKYGKVFPSEYSTIDDYVANLGEPWSFKVVDMEGVTFDGCGCTIKAADGCPAINNASMFDFKGCKKLTFKNFTLDGNLPKRKEFHTDWVKINDNCNLSIKGGSDIIIENVVSQYSMMDGFKIDGDWRYNSDLTNDKLVCRRLTVRNCKFDYNYRQGMSLMDAWFATFENCEFTNTGQALNDAGNKMGTSPMCGVDLEAELGMYYNPNSGRNEITENIGGEHSCAFRNCLFKGNRAEGLCLTNGAANTIIEGCEFVNNKAYENNSPAYIHNNKFIGNIFRNCGITLGTNGSLAVNNTFYFDQYVTVGSWYTADIRNSNAPTFNGHAFRGNVFYGLAKTNMQSTDYVDLPIPTVELVTCSNVVYDGNRFVDCNPKVSDKGVNKNIVFSNNVLEYTTDVDIERLNKLRLNSVKADVGVEVHTQAVSVPVRSVNNQVIIDTNLDLEDKAKFTLWLMASPIWRSDIGDSKRAFDVSTGSYYRVTVVDDFIGSIDLYGSDGNNFLDRNAIEKIICTKDKVYRTKGTINDESHCAAHATNPSQAARLNTPVFYISNSSVVATSNSGYPNSRFKIKQFYIKPYYWAAGYANRCIAVFKSDINNIIGFDKVTSLPDGITWDTDTILEVDNATKLQELENRINQLENK